MKGLIIGLVLLALVAGVVIISHQNSGQLSYIDKLPSWAIPAPPINVAQDPKTTGKLVSDCHGVVTSGSMAVGSKYGVPASIGAAGAKVNPYYYLCDTGGFVVNGAKKVGNWVKGLF